MRKREKIGLHPFSVIPAEAGIQYLQAVKEFLDPGLHRGDGPKAIFSQLLRTKKKKRTPRFMLWSFLFVVVFSACSGVMMNAPAGGSAFTLTVMNPRADLQGPTPIPLASRLPTLEGKRIGLVNNTKENAVLLQPELEKALREMLPSAKLNSWPISYRPFENKNRALEESAKNSDGVILLFGD